MKNKDSVKPRALEARIESTLEKGIKNTLVKMKIMDPYQSILLDNYDAKKFENGIKMNGQPNTGTIYEGIFKIIGKMDTAFSDKGITGKFTASIPNGQSTNKYFTGSPKYDLSVGFQGEKITVMPGCITKYTRENKNKEVNYATEKMGLSGFYFVQKT